jgi:uncharacterized protein with PQ loop repeat
MTEKWKFYYEKFMILWGIFSPIWILLQAIKIYQLHDAAGVSLASYILVLLGSIIWIIYAAAVLDRKNAVIIINSSITALLAVVVIIGVAIYQV